MLRGIRTGLGLGTYMNVGSGAAVIIPTADFSNLNNSGLFPVLFF
jgi:hypothetical protein